MKRAPLRFLLVVLVLWVGVRAAILLPGWPGEIAADPAIAAVPQSVTPRKSPPTA